MEVMEMQLKLLGSVPAVALGLAFAPAAWAVDAASVDGGAIALDTSPANIVNSDTETNSVTFTETSTANRTLP
jgi:hypothetical protein